MALAVVVVTMVALLPLAFVPGGRRADAAQLEIATSGWSTDGTVWDIVRVDDAVYIGGEFSEIHDDDGNTLPRANLAAFDVATGAPLTWAPTVDGEVKALALSPDRSMLYVGGDFHRVNDRYRQRMAAVSVGDGSLDSTFRANTSGRVLELLVVDDDLYIGGEIISVGGLDRKRIARVDPETGAVDSDWSPRVNGGSVRGLEAAPDGSRLYIGGTFDNIDWLDNTAHLAAIDLPGGTVDNDWQPGLDQPVFDIVAVGDDVYLAVAGPGFHNNRLQKHSAIDGSEGLRYVADGDVQDLELRGNILFVGGHFEQIFGGLERSQLAAIDIRDDHIIDFAPEVITRYGVWKALAGPEGLWLGGEFTAIGDTRRGGFAFLGSDQVGEVVGQRIVDRGRDWRYLDSGQAPQDPGWAQPGFDDGDWAVGTGELGFGDGDERTVIATTDALYARTTVTIDDPEGFDQYTIRLLADAGAAVYINGTEAFRDNLPDGPIDDETLALVGKWTNGERTYSEHGIDAGLLLAGSNTIAVEIHGAYDQPGDMSFDLELLGFRLPDGVGITETVVETGANWRYHDQGGAHEPSWTLVDFDDGTWPTGFAQFGFGDDDESTELQAGETSYRFRHRFSHDGAAVAASLRLLADDGAAVYLNGIELVRSALPDGTLTGWTKATETVWGDDEAAFTEYAIDPGLLVAGTNIVAVSVHNTWSGNGDLSFDLELQVERPPAPEPEPDPDPDPELSGPVTMVADDAVWRFLDDGTQPEQGWTGQGPAFDDGSWPKGSGEFGFGDGDEETTVTPGRAAYFFRTGFDAAAVPDQLSLNLRYDDGVAVYINGTEVARENLPGGELDATTTALNARWGDQERTDEVVDVDPTLLVAGPNTLAISVHNQWTGNSDLTLAATLTAHFGPLDAEPLVLIAGGHLWSYDDDGTDHGTAWRAPDFEDQAWSTGPALLGYGDAGQASDLAPGATTYYFRTDFTIDAAPGGMPDDLTMGLLIDDGAVVYINGTEVARQNLPEGDVLFDTSAIEPIWGQAERAFTDYDIPVDVLVPGRNVIAVEAHNRTGSADLSFDLRLVGDGQQAG